MIHVSIHDVSPRWSYEVETALAWCHDAGVKPGLLVVPDMHHRFPLREHPAFCDRLRALAHAGHEIFLHGYYHLSRDGEGLAHAFAQRIASAGEAEFAALDRADGEALLDEGLSLLRGLDLPIEGFVPPAWARRAWLGEALASRNLRYLEDQLFIYDPTRGRRRFAPALNFASRTRGRRITSVAYARLARRYRDLGIPVRIAIHPADLGYAWLVRETRAMLDWAAGDTTDRTTDLWA